MERIETMRKQISECYPGFAWKNRCACMPTKQVVAVYHAFKKNGKLSKSKNKKSNSSNEYVQMTVWDYI